MKETKSIYIKVTEGGPYLIYGQPPISEQIIVFNNEGNSWDYREGKRYNSSESPCSLCRCGESTDKPFCSGAHLDKKWDAEETAELDSFFDSGVEQFEGQGIKVHGPIWVRGGIRVESADGNNYEIRNRVALCRCGKSSNKPFCNGAHASK